MQYSISSPPPRRMNQFVNRRNYSQTVVNIKEAMDAANIEKHELKPKLYSYIEEHSAGLEPGSTSKMRKS